MGCGSSTATATAEGPPKRTIEPAPSIIISDENSHGSAQGDALLVVTTSRGVFGGTDATVIARIGTAIVYLSGRGVNKATLERGSTDTFPFYLGNPPASSPPPKIKISMSSDGEKLAAWKIDSISVRAGKTTISYQLPNPGGTWMRPGDELVLHAQPGSTIGSAATAASEHATAVRATYRLSSPKGTVGSHYDVVVVGSGYGGSVAASRFARSGLRVCVLEKGREFAPGEFPDTPLGPLTEGAVRVHPEALGGGRASSRGGETSGVVDLGRENALYQLDVFGPIAVAHGCGLGGTSLVNAGVTVRPDPRVLRDESAWPGSFLSRAGELEESYAKAERMLGAKAYPMGKNGYPVLPKQEALRKSSDKVGGKFWQPPILVSFEAETNRQGVKLAACNNCGDCCSGCNYGAKKTLDTSYLADAVNHGAEIFTECAVAHVRANGNPKNAAGGKSQQRQNQQRPRGRWSVDYRVLDAGFDVFGDAESDVGLVTVTADHVVIAAGAPGSTAILLRSQAQGVPISKRIGERFSGNGDALGVAFNCDDEIRSLGIGDADATTTAGPGPCITSILDLRHEDVALEEGMVIEDGTPPGPFIHAFAATLLLASPLKGVDTDSGIADKSREIAAYMRSALHGPYAPDGAMQRTQSHLVMSHDSATGVIVPTWDVSAGTPVDNTSDVGVRWPGAASQAGYERVRSVLQRCTSALGGTHLDMPNIFPGPAGNATTLSVHPLGGCPMGNSASDGVVDHYGRVFDTTDSSKSDRVHEGLMVVDASVLPRSIGVNPLLTISAVAEMAVAGVLAEMGRPAREDAGDIEDGGIAKRRAQPPSRPGITFTESMVGYLAPLESPDQSYKESKAIGHREGDTHTLRFFLCVDSGDVSALVDAKSGHKASLHGTVHCPMISATPMSVTRGEFRLLVGTEGMGKSPLTGEDFPANTRLMTYDFKMRARDGATWKFSGVKVIHADGSLMTDPWNDTTTLFVDIEREQGGKVGLRPGQIHALVSKTKGHATATSFRGVLRIKPTDFAKQMTTLRVTHAHSLPATTRLSIVSKFIHFFAGSLADVYLGLDAGAFGSAGGGGGGVAASLSPDVPAPPRVSVTDAGVVLVRGGGAGSLPAHGVFPRVFSSTLRAAQAELAAQGVDPGDRSKGSSAASAMRSATDRPGVSARWKVKGGRPVVVVARGSADQGRPTFVAPLVARRCDVFVHRSGEIGATVALAIAKARRAGSRTTRATIIAGSAEDVVTIAGSIRAGALPPQFVLRIYVSERGIGNDIPGVTVRPLSGDIDDPASLESIDRLD